VLSQEDVEIAEEAAVQAVKEEIIEI